MSKRRVKRLRPVESYIHSPEERVQVTPKLPMSLYMELNAAADKLTMRGKRVSMNSLTESAIRWYLDSLKDEGII